MCLHMYIYIFFQAYANSVSSRHLPDPDVCRVCEPSSWNHSTTVILICFCTIRQFSNAHANALIRIADRHFVRKATRARKMVSFNGMQIHRNSTKNEWSNYQMIWILTADRFFLTPSCHQSAESHNMKNASSPLYMIAFLCILSRHRGALTTKHCGWCLDLCKSVPNFTSKYWCLWFGGTPRVISSCWTVILPKTG